MVGSFEFMVRRKWIEADTSIRGDTWFVQASHEEGIDHGEFVARDDTLFLRYDDPNGRVLALSPGTENEGDYTCDLSGDFGAEVQCGVGFGEPRAITFDGSYNSDSRTLSVGNVAVPYASVKYDPFIVGPVPPAYYHGIGPLSRPGDGWDGTIQFTYLRLGGIEYGTPASFVGIKTNDRDQLAVVSVFPNPASLTLNVVLERVGVPVNLRVFDLLGREVGREYCTTSLCLIDISRLPAGVYHFDVSSRRGDRVARKFVVR